MKVRRINIVNSYLQDLLKSVWILEDSSYSCAGHVLLPVKEVDLMVNLSGTINHSEADSVIERGHIFSNVIRNTPVEISHNGELSVLGISFNSFSLPVLSEISPVIIRDKFYELKTIDSNYKENASLLLNIISEEVDDKWIPQKKIINIIRYFEHDCGMSKLEDICSELGISCRTAERIFAVYVHMPPKKYMRLLRFRNSLRKIISGNNENLTDVAHDCFYYDQSHFSEEFKSFAGISPVGFLKRKNSVTQNIEFV